MKKIMLVATALLASQSAVAEITFQPRVIAGIMDYEFEIPTPPKNFLGDTLRIGGGEPSQKVSDTMPFLGIGGTFLYDANFLDIYYQQTDSGSYDDNDSHTNSTGQALTNISNGTIDHSDSAIAIGRGFGSFSLSIGYKSGSTEMGQTFLLEGNGHETIYEFDLDGPFIGGSYAIPISKGTLGLTLAIASLDGEYNARLVDLSGKNSDFGSKMEGDATGVTYGVSWKAPITDNWLYALSIDAYSYDFDVKGNGILTGVGTVSGTNDLTANITESAINYKASIIYRF